MSKKFINLQPESSFNIVEIGFGAGINFLTTAKEWIKENKDNKFLNYVAFDKTLFSKEQFKKTIKQNPDLKELSKVYIHNYPSNIAGTQRIYFSSQRIFLTLILGDIKNSLSCLKNISDIDAWYFDGFAPEKNPDMWSEEIFERVNLSSHSDTTFSTYTSSRLVKNNLENSGLVYEIAKGFANKRHMLKGKTKTTKIKDETKKKRIAVIGSGIAGCTLAYKLAQRGHIIDVYEQSEEVCSGASSNSALITYPRLSAFDSPYARYCIHSFLFASAFYDSIKTKAWHKSGVFLMNHDDASNKRQNLLLKARPDTNLFKELSRKEVSKKANLKLKNGGIFFPKGGFIETRALCQDLLNNENINQILSTKIERVYEDGNKKKIYIGGSSLEYEEVCLCTGNASKHLINLPGLSSKRGQISYVESSKDFENLKFPICASGYFSPKIGNSHILGSSYSDLKEDKILQEEHISNIQKLKVIHDCDINIIDGKVGFRAVTKDRMPLLGLKKAIYVNTGHGSRGSTSSPLCAEIIADLIDKKPLPVDAEIYDALNINRFN